jgi:hypothetical protein
VWRARRAPVGGTDPSGISAGDEKDFVLSRVADPAGAYRWYCADGESCAGDENDFVLLTRWIWTLVFSPVVRSLEGCDQRWVVSKMARSFRVKWKVER